MTEQDAAAKRPREEGGGFEKSGAAQGAKKSKTTKPSAMGMYGSSSKGRPWTLTIALPASIVNNAQTDELRSYLVSQIARSLTIYSVDEVVIYEDQEELVKSWPSGDDPQVSGACTFFARNLQYLETPQYLRKVLFPMHADLKYAGLQNPLDAPHHLRKNETHVPYREGSILEVKYEPKEHPVYELERYKNKAREDMNGKFACCGLSHPVWLDGWGEIGENVRVTVKLDGNDRRFGQPVAPSEPRERMNMYWGYETRIAKSLVDVFTDAAEPEVGGGAYDLVIGTSERGVDINKAFLNHAKNKSLFPTNFKRCLVLFGGLGGLEDVLWDPIFVEANKTAARPYLRTLPKKAAETIALKESEAAEDELLSKSAAKNKKKKQKAKGAVVSEESFITPKNLCDHYVNVCPRQTSRTIRAEEALMITLSNLNNMLPY